MLPQTLQQWTIEAILDLLVKQFYECEYFDFKASLPNKNDGNGKVRLREACCAFANSQGGFLVFGIDDDSAKTPEARLVGVESQLDFPEHFGSYPKECSPSIYWNFRNPLSPYPQGKLSTSALSPRVGMLPMAAARTIDHGDFYALRLRTERI